MAKYIVVRKVLHANGTISLQVIAEGDQVSCADHLAEAPLDDEFPDEEQEFSVTTRAEHEAYCLRLSELYGESIPTPNQPAIH